METYPFRQIEARWRRFWEERSVNKTDLDDPANKLFVLVMFSYPSEKKLHIGHWWNFGPTDTFARFKRMQGFNVFEPMGFDAFGLPAENYAIKHKIHPGITTRDNVRQIREQLKQIGAMYDWDREVDTSNPNYYKWTQWLFLQLFKTGAAYRKKAPVNWCPQCMTVLANEQVKSDGACERCDTTVTQRDLEQWFFRITDFAEDLLKGLNYIQWPEATKTMQRHWIGRSEGTEIYFKTEDGKNVIKVFTTRPDTLFGVTYLVLAPENELVARITSTEQTAAVEQFVAKARTVSEMERTMTDRPKSGVFSGSYALHPATGERLPIWVGDYVIGTYGSGAVMAVPAHDQRDFEFAQKYGLPIVWVIRPKNPHDDLFRDRAFEDYGIMQSSAQFDGLSSERGMEAVTRWLEVNGAGRATVSYRLRDWSVSRQRYWGAPIPIIHCDRCGLVPVPESDLPVMLPEAIEDFTPRGISPLGGISEFINTVCPQCNGVARRDPDTMDTFVDSSWYFLRYTSTDFNDRPFDPRRIANWLPVDIYVGGPEHATGHLIYSRYITHYLNSIGLLPFKEPFKRLIHQGIINHKGLRMSKSKGNVVNPDAYVDRYGSDVFRMYLMFMGDYTVGGDWSDEGIAGMRRFQNRIWRLFNDWMHIFTEADGATEITAWDTDLNRVLNFTIKSVSIDLERFQFNTALARVMELVNQIYQYTSDDKKVDYSFLKYVLTKLALIISPFAPYMGEELWKITGGSPSVFHQKWPEWDETALVQDTVTLVVQVNGKLIERLTVKKGISADDAKKMALALPKVVRGTAGRNIRKTVFVPDKILNFVV